MIAAEFCAGVASFRVGSWPGAQFCSAHVKILLKSILAEESGIMTRRKDVLLLYPNFYQITLTKCLVTVNPTTTLMATSRMKSQKTTKNPAALQYPAPPLALAVPMSYVLTHVNCQIDFYYIYYTGYLCL